ncbi:proline-rich protein 1-like [Sesbania bispinosa]|nr:proline-rich protein 1-like [Sesbania bispinosa]
MPLCCLLVPVFNFIFHRPASAHHRSSCSLVPFRSRRRSNPSFVIGRATIYTHRSPPVAPSFKSILPVTAVVFVH